MLHTMANVTGRRSLDAYRMFIETDLDAHLGDHAASDPGPAQLALFARTAGGVPAYARFLAEHGVDPAAIRSLDDFRRLPLTSKSNYHQRQPLPARCRGGDLAACDMIAFSSGSTGQPSLWPRALAD